MPMTPFLSQSWLGTFCCNEIAVILAGKSIVLETGSILKNIISWIVYVIPKSEDKLQINNRKHKREISNVKAEITN